MSRRKELYFAYVQSHLTYMLPIYSECPKYKLNELQVIQNWCIKSMFRLHRYTPSTYLYSTRLLPINELSRVERAVNIYKIINSGSKNNFNLLFNSDVHGRNLRTRNNIHLTHSANAALKSAIIEYNRIDLDIRQLTSVETFKERLRLEVMLDSKKFNAISPYLYIN